MHSPSIKELALEALEVNPKYLERREMWRGREAISSGKWPRKIPVANNAETPFTYTFTQSSSQSRACLLDTSKLDPKSCQVSC